MEARGGIEPPMMVLQTIALPLGDRATEQNETRSGEGRREKEAFAAQFPALHYKFLRPASINGSKVPPYRMRCPPMTKPRLPGAGGQLGLSRSRFVDNRGSDKIAPFGP